MFANVCVGDARRVPDVVVGNYLTVPGFSTCIFFTSIRLRGCGLVDLIFFRSCFFILFSSCGISIFFYCILYLG